MAQQQQAYPVSVRGELTQPPGRGWWLIKWLLAIPHFIILAFLGIAFIIVSIIAFFAILFTEKYPRGLFDFNVGVLRWGWRVGFYAWQPLGTDKYPPFTLQSVDSYPADLQVEYPERLSRGLVLVKWWLLAIPHYIVVGVFTGGGGGANAGLATILAVFGAVACLFTGKYPNDIFNVVVGMNRWTFRAWASAGLMTDKYPPFRFSE